MLENINVKVIEKLEDLRLNLSHLWLLEGIDKGTCNSSTNELLFQALERKAFIFNGALTQNGKDFLLSLEEDTKFNVSSIKNEIKAIKEKNRIDFDKWWHEIFPSTDNFEWKGKKFSGSRSLRIKKEVCKKYFQEMVKSGEFSADDINSGTENHVRNAMDQSLRSGENKVSYIANAERYLRERMFAPYIKLSVKKEESPITTGVDI